MKLFTFHMIKYLISLSLLQLITLGIDVPQGVSLAAEDARNLALSGDLIVDITSESPISGWLF